MSRLFAIAVLGVCVSIATSAQATLITSSTNGEVFADDFEGGTVGSAPDNGAQPGYWTVGAGAGIVVDASYNGGYLGTSPIPAAAQGSKSLGVTGYWGVVAPRLESTVSTGSARMEWMTFLPSAIPEHGFFTDGLTTLTNAAPDPGTGIGIVQQYVESLGSYEPTGVTYQTNTWQKWVLDINKDTNKFTLSVGGQTASGLDLRYTGGFNRFDFYWGSVQSATGGSYFIDAVPVPEPSAIALLAAGLIGLLAYAWRKRK